MAGCSVSVRGLHPGGSFAEDLLARARGALENNDFELALTYTKDCLDNISTGLRDEAEAVSLANDTPYGLSGSIWSRDIGKALRVARGVRAGVLSINCNNSVHTEAPFGGYKMSGIGRELGMSAIEMYTETKNIFIDLRP